MEIQQRKNLMVGDWVLWKNKPVQLVMIDGHIWSFNHVDINIAYCNDFGDGIERHDLSSISPIPLTKAIMFANGFESNGCKGVLVHKTDKDLKVYYEIDHFAGDNNDWVVKEWSVVGIAGIETVHEYQHYLRLVGKSDFADNFKVK